MHTSYRTSLIWIDRSLFNQLKSEWIWYYFLMLEDVWTVSTEISLCTDGFHWVQSMLIGAQMSQRVAMIAVHCIQKINDLYISNTNVKASVFCFNGIVVSRMIQRTLPRRCCESNSSLKSKWSNRWGVACGWRIFDVRWTPSCFKW